MKSQYCHLKSNVISLRKNGRTYSEIIKNIGQPIPKSTLSMWCANIDLAPKYQRKINATIRANIHRGRALALAVNRVKREKYLKEIDNKIKHLSTIFKNRDVAKISLAMLYLGEGSKTQRSSLMFGNSDPRIIKLFTELLRYCYEIDESKFRCTLQCRADQDIKRLEKFWSEISKIQLSQFYSARIDQRSIGKKSKKLDYKGVCRIDYFSADLFNEIMKIIELIDKKGL